MNNTVIEHAVCRSVEMFTKGERHHHLLFLTVVFCGLFLQHVEGAAPAFNTATPSTYSIIDSTATGVNVATVLFTDADTADTLDITMVINDYFTLVDNGDKSGTVKTHATTAVLGASGTTVTLTFIAIDTSDFTATGSYNITITNVVPSFTGLPTSVQLSEDTVLESLVYTITCTDPSDTVSSSRVSVTPSNSPKQEIFFVQKIPSTTNYGVYNRATTDSSQGTLDYNIQRSYVIVVQCTDGKDAVTSSLTINLKQNEAPVITTPATVSKSVASTTTAGTVVYTLTATDNENDAISYSYISSPSNGPFHVLASGAVYAKVALSSITTPSTYTYTISPNDAKNTGTSVTLILSITAVNSAPAFSNLNNSVIVNENTATSTSLFQVTATDGDGDTLTLWMTSLPAYGTALFELDASKNIKTKSALNYETITDKVYELIISVSDGKASVTGTLTVTLANVNELLTWTSSSYRADIAEGSPVGTTLTPNGLNTTDPDTGDTVTCHMTCVLAGYFSMSTSCNITVSSVYSLDAGLANTVTCGVTGIDSGGNTANTTLIIDIVDTNNYTPSFAVSTYTYTVTGYEAINTTLGSFTATDGDRGTYGEFSYSLNQAQLSGTIFNINSTSGVITTAISMEDCKCTGNTWTIPVYATDQGGLIGTAYAVITVGVTTTILTTTTTDRVRTFLEYPANAAWFSVLVVALAIGTIVTGAVLITQVFDSTRFVCRDRHRPSNRLYNRDGYGNSRMDDADVPARNHPQPTHYQPWRNEHRFW